MKLKLLRTIPNVQVHFSNDKYCISTAGSSVKLSVDSAERWRGFATIPLPLYKSLLLNSFLITRLIRGGIHAVLSTSGETGEELIVVVNKKLLLVSSNGRSRVLLKVARGRRPLRRGLCVVDDNLFIGEYWSNPERTAVNVHKVHVPTQKTEIFHQFSARSVRHIHTVDKDPYASKLWVSTGDEDPECRIVLLDPDTGQAETIGAGSQKWRTVSFAFRPDAVYWGTDNHLGENQIWRFDRVSGQTKPIEEVIGPVYYNACLKDYIVFGTTVEKGEGQQDGYGRLYAVNRQDRVAEVWKQRKDRWHPRWFGYGVFEFAEGSGHDNQFWVTEKGFEPGLRSLLFELSDE